jgi:hypothetical protein
VPKNQIHRRSYHSYQLVALLWRCQAKSRLDSLALVLGPTRCGKTTISPLHNTTVYTIIGVSRRQSGCNNYPRPAMINIIMLCAVTSFLSPRLRDVSLPMRACETSLFLARKLCRKLFNSEEDQLEIVCDHVLSSETSVYDSRSIQSHGRGLCDPRLMVCTPSCKLQAAVGPTMTRHMMASAVVSAPSRSDWIGAEDQRGVGGRRSIIIIADRRHMRCAYVGKFRGYAPSIQPPVYAAQLLSSQASLYPRKRLKKLCSNTRLSGPVELTTVGVDLR